MNIQSLPYLSGAQRQQARLIARERVKNSIIKPVRNEFNNNTTRYPRYISYLILLSCMILLCAAYIPSAIRLYTIGTESFKATIKNTSYTHLSTVVGISTPIAAEIGQFVCALALSVFGSQKRVRFLLYLGIFITTMIALIGNIVQSYREITNIFGWIEAIYPPVLSAIIFFVIKEIVFDNIESYYANEKAYRKALSDWALSVANPEHHPSFQVQYAQALKDVYYKTYKRKYEHELNQLGDEDWINLILRELHLENRLQSQVEQPLLVSQNQEKQQKRCAKCGNSFTPTGKGNYKFCDSCRNRPQKS